MKHKNICWGGYSIPVPLNANWMAQDAGGDWKEQLYWIGD